MGVERLTARTTAGSDAPDVPVPQRASHVGSLAENAQRLRVASDELRTARSAWASQSTRIRRVARDAPRDRVIRRRVDQSWAQYKLANPIAPVPAPALGAPPVASPLLAVAVAYMQIVRAEFNQLPAELRQGAQGLLTAARNEGNRIAAGAPTTAEVDDFVDNFVDPLVDEVNRVADLVAGRQQEPEEDGPEEWVFEAGELAARANRDVVDDLDTMLEQISASFHGAGIKSLIGGFAVKGECKKIKLNNASARVDREKSPGNKTYNVQYQMGGNSYANVVFCDADSQDEVKHQLAESLRLHQKATSPGARALLGLR